MERIASSILTEKRLKPFPTAIPPWFFKCFVINRKSPRLESGMGFLLLVEVLPGSIFLFHQSVPSRLSPLLSAFRAERIYKKV
jgi:hypothetical protein